MGTTTSHGKCSTPSALKMACNTMSSMCLHIPELFLEDMPYEDMPVKHFDSFCVRVSGLVHISCMLSVHHDCHELTTLNQNVCRGT